MSDSPLEIRTILITGATGGIGNALAEAYAAPGIKLILHGRREAALAELAARCEAKGAEVLSKVMDLRDVAHWAAWLGKVCEQEPIDLVFANAGVNTNIGEQNEGERWEAVDELLDVNVKAVMATVHAVLPSMRARGKGQIVLVSSLAAFFGLPVTPSYSASKAAIKAYGEGLRGWLEPEGIRVNVIMPGYVESKMCREMPGPKPFLWQPEKAARLIKRKLAANKPRITFPFPLDYGCWWLSVLPPGISQRILHLLDYAG